MADGHPPAIPVSLREVADIFYVHALGGVAQIEMHVDIDVVFARDREDPVDLPARIAVDIGNGAECAGTSTQSLDQQLLRTGIVEETLLRKGANLDVDRPCIISGELQDGVETTETDARIDLDVSPHQHRAIENAFFQRALCSCVDILFGEGALGSSGLR